VRKSSQDHTFDELQSVTASSFKFVRRLVVVAAAAAAAAAVVAVVMIVVVVVVVVVVAVVAVVVLHHLFVFFLKGILNLSQVTFKDFPRRLAINC
jgi:Flp pilus assembly protein TadB